MRSIFVLLFFLPSLLLAQTTILNPNQIAGRVEYTNSNPEIIEAMTREVDPLGFYEFFVSAVSVSPRDLLPHAYLLATDRKASDFLFTVEAGRDYDVKVYAWDNQKHSRRYHFKGLRSELVSPEPAEDTPIEFKECASLVRVHFQDSEGNPFTVAGGKIEAIQVESIEAETGEKQAYASLYRYFQEKELLIRGSGELFRIETFYETGTDIFSDTLSRKCVHHVTATCDEVIDLVCGDTLDESTLGSLSGSIDFNGVEESYGGMYSAFVHALRGPWGNQRAAKLYDFPQSLDFTLPNLVPTSVETHRRWFQMLRTAILEQLFTLIRLRLKGRSIFKGRPPVRMSSRV